MNDALKNSPIHIQQHGFHTDRNTDTAISTVTDYIEKHIYIYNQKHVIGVFLDIQAAFDSIKPSKMHYLECLFAVVVFLHMAQGIAKAKKSRSVCKQIDGFGVVKMANNQAAGQN